MLLAVLEKRVGFNIGTKDIFLNIIGGLKVDEPSLDLAIVLAMLSSYHDRALGTKIAAVGEIGLTGEIRPVPRLEHRLMELSKLGYTHCYVPKTNRKTVNLSLKMTLIPCLHIQNVMTHFLTYECTSA